jgi:hypothetical protein
MDRFDSAVLWDLYEMDMVISCSHLQPCRVVKGPSPVLGPDNLFMGRGTDKTMTTCAVLTAEVIHQVWGDGDARARPSEIPKAA